MKIERLRKSNEELLKDVEELTDENTKLLGKVKLLVNEEGRLRDQLQAHSQTEIELKNQLMKSFEAKANNKMTPEKEAHFDSAFKHIDNSSINVCPTCESLREDNKDLSRRLKTSQKELEMMNIRNEELLKQIRLMAISEEAIPERQEQRLQREITIETPSKSNTRLADDAALQKPKFSLQEEFLERTKFTDSKERREELSFRPTTSSPQLIEKDTPNTTNYGMRPDLAETLRSLKESKNKLENFQFKMQKQKEDWEALNTPFNPKPLGLQNRHSGFESKPYDAQRERQNPFDFSENSNFLKQQAPNTGDSILPKKRDFSLPRATELNEKLTSLLGGHINDKAGQSSREDQGRSVFNYFKANHSEGFKNYDQFSGLGYNEKGRGSNIGRQREALMFKDLEALEKLEKDDISKLRPRREERLLSTLDDRIKADRSVDFGGREPNRYLTSEDPSTRGDFQKKQRKSIGHAPQSRYLERLSKLYEGEEGQTSASITQDLSFVSNRRMSSSQDRTVLAGQDGFLRQINDRINSLVTK
jgi:hypothetical protein